MFIRNVKKKKRKGKEKGGEEGGRGGGGAKRTISPRDPELVDVVTGCPGEPQRAGRKLSNVYNGRGVR